MKVGRHEMPQRVKVQPEHTIQDVKQELLIMKAFRKLWKHQEEPVAENLWWTTNGAEVGDDTIPDMDGKHLVAWKKAAPEKKRKAEQSEQDAELGPVKDEEGPLVVVKRGRSSASSTKDWLMPHVAVTTQAEYEECQKAYKRAHGHMTYARAKGRVAESEHHAATTKLLGDKLAAYTRANTKGVVGATVASNQQDLASFATDLQGLYKKYARTVERNNDVVQSFDEAGLAPQRPLPDMQPSFDGAGMMQQPMPLQMQMMGMLMQMMMAQQSPQAPANLQMLQSMVTNPTTPVLQGQPTTMPQPTTPMQPPTRP